MKPIVVIESPYAGDIERNPTYARRAMQDSLRRGEAPIASHLLYTQPGVLRDDVPEERRMGMGGEVARGHLEKIAALRERLEEAEALLKKARLWPIGRNLSDEIERFLEDSK